MVTKVDPGIVDMLNGFIVTFLTKIGRTEYQGLLSAIVVTVLEGAGVLNLDFEMIIGMWGGTGAYAASRAHEHSTADGGRKDTDA